MLNKTILKNLLNVKHTAIDDLIFNTDGSITIQVHPTKGEQCRCSLCGRKSPRYDAGRGSKLWRTCDWNTHIVYLQSDVPRVNCPKHGVVTAAVPWARHDSSFTYEFEHMTAWISLNCSRKVVAAFMRIAWNTVGPIISRVRHDVDYDPSKRFDGLVNIGVDETSYKKGHKYITVIVNHDNGKVVWLHEGHGKAVFTEFFKALSPQQLESIKLISGDGARWIQNCMDEFCPDARRCIDPFHVVEWAMEALDKVRAHAVRDARKQVEQGPKRKVGRPPKDAPKPDTTAKDIKGSKFALGKAPENLTARQKAQVELIAKKNNRLYRAYLLKEELRLVFQQDLEAGKTQLDHFIKWAQHCRIPEFVELQRKIRRHYDAILATLEHGLSNARIEAVNNKIKLTIRMAYGFRNIDNMIDMIMLRCSDIQVKLPWEAQVVTHTY